jgi:hypothetical protein
MRPLFFRSMTKKGSAGKEDRHASTQAYIDYMRPRCVQLARVLKKTGSFYYIPQTVASPALRSIGLTVSSLANVGECGGRGE